MTLLSVQGVSKTFRRRRGDRPTPAVDDVSFELDAGQALAVVGESGAGKSTVGRLVARLLDADSGTITFDGTDLTPLRGRRLRPVRRDIQMIFQDPFNSLDPTFSIGRSVSEPLRIHTGLSRAERDRKAVELLERVGLDAAHMSRRPREMSGGQLQRVAIARALAVEPKLLICDEPVAALDVSIRAEILNVMLDLRESVGLALLFITHDLSTVQVVADDILVMYSGRVVESGACEQIFANPSHSYTRTLIDAIPSVPADITDAPSNGRSGHTPESIGAGIGDGASRR